MEGRDGHRLMFQPRSHARGGQGCGLLREEATAMTGSSMAPVVIAIVIVLALTGWLGLVFWAAAHPEWKAHRAAPKVTSLRADVSWEIAGWDGGTVAGHEEDAAVHGA